MSKPVVIGTFSHSIGKNDSSVVFDLPLDWGKVLVRTFNKSLKSDKLKLTNNKEEWFELDNPIIQSKFVTGELLPQLVVPYGVFSEFEGTYVNEVAVERKTQD